MLRMRIRTIERFFHALRDDARLLIPGNKDGFIQALGKDPKDYETESGGYDATTALEDSAMEDWQESERG